LLEIRDRLAPEDAYVTAVGLKLTRQQLEDGGFAGAVGPEQSQSIPWPDEQRSAGQDLGARIAEMCVGELGETQPLAFMNSRM
jgi:hypothetical protein